MLDLERAKEKVKRLKAMIKEEEERFAVYLREELGLYLKHRFESVAWAGYVGSDNNVIKVGFKKNDCLLRIPPMGDNDSPLLSVDGSLCMTLYPDENDVGCYLHSTTRSDEEMMRRLTALATVLPDARRIVRDIIPEWRANPPCAEALMTTRVLHWLAKEYRGCHPLADVIAGTLIKMIH